MQRELYDHSIGVAIKWDDEVIVYINQAMIPTLEDMKDGEVLEVDDDRHGNAGLFLAIEGNFRFCRRGINGKSKHDIDFPRNAIDFDTEDIYDYRIKGKEEENKEREAELKAARLHHNKTTNQERI